MGMDDATEQTPDKDSANESDMPKTGQFPVAQRSEFAAPSDKPTTSEAAPSTSSSFPASDYPTQRHLPATPTTGQSYPGTHQFGGPGSSGPFASGHFGIGSGPTFPPAGGPGQLTPQYAGPPRRHPWEIPLLVLVILVTLGVYIAALAFAAYGTFDRYLLLLLLVPIVIWFVRGQTWAMPRVQGVQLTPAQFPEGYDMVREAAARYGMREVPDAYVVLGNGQINAFASGHGFRRFVVIYSYMFEIGGKARDPEALAYVIGHEVGHIAAGHTSYWRQIGSFAMGYIPILGSALSRAQEYTADNYGYFNQPGGVPGGMGVMGAGKYLGREVDFDQLADRASTERGFFTWLANLLASHPVLTWRAAALRNRTKAGSLFFAPGQTVRGIGGGAVSMSGPVVTYNKQEVLAPPPSKVGNTDSPDAFGSQQR